MNQWLPLQQLAGLPGLRSNLSRCRDLLSQLGVARRQRGERGGGYEYSAADLPEETQQALAVRAASSVAGAVRPTADAIKAGREAQHSAQVQACADSMARYGVQLEARGAFDPATNPRLDLFQRFEAYHRARGGAVWPALTEFCELWSAGQIEALPTTRAAFPSLPAKTLDKWYRSWRVVGVEALLERKPRKDKGQSALAKDAQLYEAFIGALAGIHDPTARQVRRVIVSQLGEDRAPSQGTLKRWLREFKASNKVALLRFKNPDAFKNKYRAAFGSLSETVRAINQLWELDSTIADVMLIDPETGEVRRHAIISCVDVFSRRAKFLVTRTSSANGIKALVRHCILDWGKPETVKTDNGKDYTAQDFDFALQALKIEHRLSTPFSPEQKGHIERVQGTMLHDLFPMLIGFVGHSVEQRKAIESAKSFAERFGRKNEVIELRMSPLQLQAVIDGWVQEYEQREHSSLGCSPSEMAQTTHVIRIDERALDLLLMPVAGSGIRTVTKRGIKLDHGWFQAPALAAVMGQEVRCRQDEADLGALHVFGLDGTYICRALDHTLLGINRAELAAKARVVQDDLIRPFQHAMRQAKRSGVVQRAVDEIYRDREQAAIGEASNVTRLAPRSAMETTPAVASVLAAQDTSAQATARERARAELAAADQAPVVRMDTPKQRYSAWVRLQARRDAGELLAQREVDWINSYQGSAEFEGWHALHQGSDPLAEAAG